MYNKLLLYLILLHMETYSVTMYREIRVCSFLERSRVIYEECQNIGYRDKIMNNFTGGIIFWSTLRSDFKTPLLGI